MSPTLRLALALGVLSGWMVLLFSGIALGGAVHLLLLGALAVTPWRALLGAPVPAPPAAEEDRGDVQA